MEVIDENKCNILNLQIYEIFNNNKIQKYSPQ